MQQKSILVIRHFVFGQKVKVLRNAMTMKQFSAATFAQVQNRVLPQSSFRTSFGAPLGRTRTCSNNSGKNQKVLCSPNPFENLPGYT